ncbi:heme anaerobic degradation radical SAM methyltransferase ChuW/HutW [Marinobacter salexigens]|uniref:Heme anaerobic degradation radical SAM methyltransferase ChuW/HutW n=1 Tax=Marinobacter salexigens TaxID=1925763 RepID=A0ABS6A4F9_9GAMM|nr:heme anaerobic degradation radical SAM methyltransferase ChuW/HutW [Marinobacter salexigens]
MQPRKLPPASPQPSLDPIREAYSARVPLMPWKDKTPFPESEVGRQWATIEAAAPDTTPRLAYVHVPFCANHCLFCGFYKNHYHRSASAPYIDAVIQEIIRDARRPFVVGGAPIEALYLGGGTPTALETPDLVRLITALRTHLPLASDCEITLEGRILHFDQEKVEASLAAGVNRISIGVQSFNTEVRKAQGRKADREQAIQFIESLIARRQAAIVIDLMYGLPGQTPEIWQQDLNTSLELAPDGLDVYCLSMIPGTPLGKAVASGKMPPPASLADQGSYYQQATRTLSAAGWHQVSNSHWARTTRERNRYNLMIKAGADTLAFGSGAGGSIGQFSYHNQSDLAAYLEQTRNDHKALGGMMVADHWQTLREKIIAGVEVGRLSWRELDATLPDLTGATSAWARLSEQWQAAGLAVHAHETLWLTTAGRFWGNNLQAHAIELLIAPLQQSRAIETGRIASDCESTIN